MIPLPSDAVLLLIDVQQGFDEPNYWGPRNNPGAEHNMARLLAAWRASGRPVYHVQHLSVLPQSPLHPDKPGVAHKPEVAPRPGEPLIQKQANSAFVGTDLEQQLRDNNYDTLVIVGLTTPHCVSTTTRMAGNLGFNTYLVADATAAFALTDHKGETYPAEAIHNHELAALHEEFATVVETEEVLKAL